VYSSDYGHHHRLQRRSARQAATGSQRRAYSFSGRKRIKSHSGEGERMQRKTRRKKSSAAGPTDSDIDRTYTGLDRELAEEFIEQTMDPAVVLERTKASQGHAKEKGLLRGPSNTSPGSQSAAAAVQSGTESEAW
jgi:hypothetical protein